MLEAKVRPKYFSTWWFELWGVTVRWRLWLVALTALIGFVWWRIDTGVKEGRAPLPSWMILAWLAVVIMLFLTIQRFAEQVRQATNARHAVGRGPTASLILQFVIIIVGNAWVIWRMGDMGILFRYSTGDALNFKVALYVLSLLPVLWLLRGAGVSWKWLALFGWNKPWAKFWYTMALKVSPQGVQAVTIFTGGGRIDPWGIVLLAILGMVRFYDALSGLRANRSTAAAWALWLGTAFDLFTVSAVLVATLTRV